MNFDILDLEGKKVGSIDLSDAVFGAPVREHLLWEVVRAQLATRRRGTASTKTRGEVRGSTKKIYRQKGTGRARHGSIRAPIFAGGGEVFGPRPRDYTMIPPKKVRSAALRVAVSLRAREGNLIIVDALRLPALKTKAAAAKLQNIGAGSSLIVERAQNEVFTASVRNLVGVKCLAPEGLNVYDVLRFPRLVMTAETAKAIEERLAASAQRPVGRAEAAPKVGE
ncbi:MAG: 50S ribosomal protein L4 [Myxococcota bacterium]